MDAKQMTGGAGQNAAPADPPRPTNKMRRGYKHVATRGAQYSRYLACTTDVDNVGFRVSMPYSVLKLLISCIRTSSLYHVTNITDQEFH
jgi:hypothetical protein